MSDRVTVLSAQSAQAIIMHTIPERKGRVGNDVTSWGAIFPSEVSTQAPEAFPLGEEAIATYIWD